MLVGIIDNDIELTWDQVLPSKTSIPEPIIRAVKADAEGAHDLLSASHLCGCLRAAWLKQKVDYFEALGRRLPLMMGTFVHNLLIADNSWELCEHPVAWTTPDGLRVTGHIDHVDLLTGVLSDYKTTRWMKISALPYGTHAIQANIYRWLAEHNDDGKVVDIVTLQVVYIDLTGPDKNGTHQGIHVCPIPIWNDDAIEEYISSRAQTLACADKDTPPMVERAQNWLCQYCPPRIFEECESLGV